MMKSNLGPSFFSAPKYFLASSLITCARAKTLDWGACLVWQGEGWSIAGVKELGVMMVNWRFAG